MVAGVVAERTVLLVDDSATIRSILRVYLTGMGFEFLEAPDGNRALALLKLVPVELAIVDVKMEGMDGITLVERVRAEPQRHIRQVPLILLTAENDDSIRLRGLAAGANDFVKKPVDARSLRAVIERLVAEAGPR